MKNALKSHLNVQNYTMKWFKQLYIFLFKGSIYFYFLGVYCGFIETAILKNVSKILPKCTFEHPYPWWRPFWIGGHLEFKYHLQCCLGNIAKSQFMLMCKFGGDATYDICMMTFNMIVIFYMSKIDMGRCLFEWL